MLTCRVGAEQVSSNDGTAGVSDWHRRSTTATRLCRTQWTLLQQRMSTDVSHLMFTHPQLYTSTVCQISLWLTCLWSNKYWLISLMMLTCVWNEWCLCELISQQCSPAETDQSWRLVYCDSCHGLLIHLISEQWWVAIPACWRVTVWMWCKHLTWMSCLAGDQCWTNKERQ